MNRMKSHALNWLNDVLYRIKNKGEDRWSLVFNNEQLELLKNDKKVTEILLCSVVEITSYKTDLITFDPVCVCFKDESGNTLEIREDMDGFKEFINDELNHHFDVENDWFSSVNAGSFTTNSRVIWKR